MSIRHEITVNIVPKYFIFGINIDKSLKYVASV
jgi:hypothetical protein